MTIDAAHSILFVPADRPDRFARAFASHADVVVLDLEDGVAPEAKARARRNIVELRGDSSILVRVNRHASQWFDDDLAALTGLSGVSGIMVPKAEDPAAVATVARRLDKPVVPLVESVRGLLHLRDIAAADGVVRLAFGAVDFGLDTGMSEAALDPARFAVALESRYAGLPPPLDSPTMAYRDAQALRSDIDRARNLGFGGKLCIHPAQVGPVNAGFAPTDDEIDTARRIVAASDAAGGGATALGGELIDRPVVERALRVLRAASGDDRG